MPFLKRKIKYQFIHRGVEKWFSVMYTLFFSGHRQKGNFELLDIRNEYGHSVKKDSEVWDYFSEQFTAQLKQEA